MNRSRRVALVLLCAFGTVSLVSCGGDDGASPQGDPAPWLDEPTDSFPAALADVGLYEDMPSATPSDRVFAYHVQFPLFSDDNTKTRYVHLPEGAAIDVSDPDAWVFPVGATLFKTFHLTALGNTAAPRIETRILHKRADGWDVGTYVWNEANTGATLTDGQEVRIDYDLPDGAYTYSVPSRNDCVACHAGTPDFVAGFDRVQLSEPSTGVTQLETLTSLGFFDDDVDVAAIEGSAVQRAAIGHLHGNCSNCHNPDGPAWFTTQLDLRYTETYAATVDQRSRRFYSTNEDFRLIKPGDPTSSVVYRMMLGDLPGVETSMPPIGTSLLDEAGLASLAAWIEELQPLHPEESSR